MSDKIYVIVEGIEDKLFLLNLIKVVLFEEIFLLGRKLIVVNMR